jgi:hypothetical protein
MRRVTKHSQWREDSRKFGVPILSHAMCTPLRYRPLRNHSRPNARRFSLLCTMQAIPGESQVQIAHGTLTSLTLSLVFCSVAKR